MDLSKLSIPFPEKDVEFRIGATNADKSKGIALAYITNRAIQNRLDEVCGQLDWKNEFKKWGAKGQLCGISIWDKDKKEWITKWDGADNTNIESTKGGLSDAMKRAGYQWSIGRYLYSLPNQWVSIKQQGKSYVLVNNPKLPNEFLPENEYTTIDLLNLDQVTEIQDIIREKKIEALKFLDFINQSYKEEYKEIADIKQKHYVVVLKLLNKKK